MLPRRYPRRRRHVPILMLSTQSYMPALAVILLLVCWAKINTGSTFVVVALSMSSSWSTPGATTNYLASLRSSDGVDSSVGPTANEPEHKSLDQCDAKFQNENQLVRKEEDYLYWIAKNEQSNYRQKYETSSSRIRTTKTLETQPKRRQRRRQEEPQQEHHFVQNVVGTMLRPCRGRFCTFMGNHPNNNNNQRTNLDLCLTICCQATPDFLASRPGESLRDIGVQIGDVGCISIHHWQAAHRAGVAPPIFLQATHALVLQEIDFHLLMKHALDQKEALQGLQQLQLDRRECWNDFVSSASSSSSGNGNHHGDESDDLSPQSTGGFFE